MKVGGARMHRRHDKMDGLTRWCTNDGGLYVLHNETETQTTGYVASGGHKSIATRSVRSKNIGGQSTQMATVSTRELSIFQRQAVHFGWEVKEVLR